MHLDNGLLQNVKKNTSIYVQNSAKEVGLQPCSTFTTKNLKFHIFIAWNIFSKNQLVKPFSYVFADLTLCGVTIRKRGQLRMERGNKKFFQIHTEKCHDGLLEP